MKLNYSKVLLYFFYSIIFAFILRELWSSSQSVKNISFSSFQQLLEKGELSQVEVSEHSLKGRLRSPADQDSFVSTQRLDFETADQLKRYGVDYSMKFENTFFRDVILWTLPFLIIFVIWSFLFRKVSGLQSGMMSVGKSKAKIFVETDIKVTFNDVAGVDEAKAELQELVHFLKDPPKYERLGGRMPKGVLLVGPPGTGKTLIAKAVAGEAGVPFFSTNGAEFVEMFVGIGAARVRDLFDQARMKAPCIIFIDELDALGKIRMTHWAQSNDEKEQTLNQLLAELDGFDSRSGIVLLAATNRPEILDPALLRSGRFDKQILIDKPDRKGRFDILKIHTRDFLLDQKVDLQKIAALTPGFTGADIANLVNEASLIAVRRNAQSICEVDFTEAIERLLAGLERKNRLINPFERTVVAHHEMGHAIVATALGLDPIHKVSIIPRGIGSLGYNIQRPTEDRFLMTKEELEKKMCVLLGGRAAEKVIFGHLSTGAVDDLEKASEIAWSIVARFGMSEELGEVVFESPSLFGNEDRFSQSFSRYYSEETAKLIDQEVRELVRSAIHWAVMILRQNKKLLEQSAAILLEKETLNESDLKTMLCRVIKFHVIEGSSVEHSF